MKVKKHEVIKVYSPSNPKPHQLARIEELNKSWGKIQGMNLTDTEKEALMKARISRSGLTSADATAARLKGVIIDPKVQKLWK